MITDKDPDSVTPPMSGTPGQNTYLTGAVFKTLKGCRGACALLVFSKRDQLLHGSR
jgi:hypothetical protein